MSLPLTINGIVYAYPQTGDVDWGPDATDWAAAVTVGMLQKAGGAFTLTAEVDFGATYGLKSAYLKSRAASVAAAGAIRLGSADIIAWRNNGDDGDLELTTDASDNLTFNGNIISNSSGVIPPTAGGTGISTYTTGDTLYSSSANVLSKLAIGAANLVYTSDGSIPGWSLLVNANFDAAAALALTKLAATTASRALVSDASGFIVPATTTDTEIGYVNGVTSAIQTQLNTKAPAASPTFTGTVTTPLSTAGPVLTSAGGVLSSEATLAVARGGTNVASYTKGDILAASAAAVLTKLAVGADGTVLTADSGQTTGLNWTSPLTNPMTTLGDIITGGVAGAATRLSGDTSNANRFLRSLSVAGTATAPSWQALVAGDIPSLAASIITSGTLATARGGTNLDTSASTGVPVIAAGTWSVSSALALNRGGTGQTTKAAAFDALSPMSAGGDLIYGGASGTGTRLTNGTVGQYLASGGGTAAPVWTTFSSSISESGSGANWPISGGQWGDMASVVLAAGVYLISGMFNTFNNGAVAANPLRIGIGTTSGNNAPNLSIEVSINNVGTTGLRYQLVAMPFLVVPGGSTTYYLKAKLDGSATNFQYLAYQINALKLG